MKTGKKIRTFLLFAALAFTTSVVAGHVKRESVASSSWSITARTVDAKLPGSDARIRFTFSHYEKGLSEQTVMIQYNTTKKSAKSNVKGMYSMALKPGKYTFTLTQAGCDTLVEKLEVKKQERIDISVNFGQYVPADAEAEKPVIYLYPTKKTNVKVDINPHGEFLFTYPAYDNGWNVTAYPDGTIESDGKKYNYLFWESTVNNLVGDNQNIGYVVARDTLLDFLENSLTTMGLNSKEQQDFITYWYPQMVANETNMVRFLFNEDCGTVAEMTITPKPDHVFRVYMLWTEVGSEETPVLKPQEMPVITRKGFTVVEWGGIKVENGVIAVIPDNN